MPVPCGAPDSTTTNSPRSPCTATLTRACGRCLPDGAEVRWFALTTRGAVGYDTARYQPGDVLVFGPETRGLPGDLLAACPEDRQLRIPMQAGARSLNLSNAVAIVVYEAWRQLGWAASAAK